MIRIAALILALTAASASAQALRDDMYVTNGPVYSQALVGNTLYLGGQFTRVGPATGGFMPTDVTTGAKSLPALGVDGAVNAIVNDGAGGYILGGSFSHYQGVARANLARVDANGTLLDWNPGVTGVVKTLAVGGGRVYVGGAFSAVGGLARSNLAAVDLATAAVSTTWIPNSNAAVLTLAYLNGLVYVGGEFFAIAGTQRAYGCALDGATGAATQWQPNADGPIWTMALRYDRIALTTYVYVGGQFTVCGGAFRRNFALVDATQGSQTFSTATSFDPSPDGRVRAILTIGNTIPTVYVAGEFKNIAGTARNYVAAFQGTTLKAFNPNPDGGVTTLALSGSSLFMSGGFTTPRLYAAQVSTTDGSVLPWDAGVGGIVRAFLQSGSTMWLGGEFTTMNAIPRANLAAIDLATGQPTAWNPGTNGPVYVLESIGNWLYAGGQYNSLGGVAHSNIGRIGPTGNVDESWRPFTNLPVYAIAGRSLGPGSNMVYLGGAFTFFMGQPRNRLAALTDVSPATLQSWNPNAGTSGSVLALGVDATYVYVGGNFSTLGPFSIRGLGKVDFAGNAVGWGPQPAQPIQFISMGATTLYVGFQGLNNFTGGPRYGIAELDKATAAATPWNPGTDPAGIVLALKRSGNAIYLGGFFHVLGGQPREMLGAVDAVSGVATSFNPTMASWFTSPGTYGTLVPAVTDLDEVGGKLYAGGQFTSATGKPHSGLAGFFESTVDVADGPAPGVALRAIPNPAATSQSFAFSLPAPGHATLVVADVEGRLVRRLDAGDLAAGPHRLDWDGRNASGATVRPGIYFARLATSAGTHSELKILRF